MRERETDRQCITLLDTSRKDQFNLGYTFFYYDKNFLHHNYDRVAWVTKRSRNSTNPELQKLTWNLLLSLYNSNGRKRNGSGYQAEKNILT